MRLPERTIAAAFRSVVADGNGKEVISDSVLVSAVPWAKAGRNLVGRYHFVVVAVAFEQDGRRGEQFFLRQFAVAIGVQQLEQRFIDVVHGDAVAAPNGSFPLHKQFEFNFSEEESLDVLLIVAATAPAGNLEWSR